MRYWLPVVALPLLALAGCAIVDRPDAANPAAYCSPENAFRLGALSRAYLGGCPREAEAAFVAAIQRGRSLRTPPGQALPYYDRMQRLEQQFLATGSQAERDKLREELRLAEWWAVHIVNSPGSYSVDN